MAVTLVNTATVFDSSDPNLALGGSFGATFAFVGGNPYLYVGGFSDSGISAFTVSASGQLANVAQPGGNVFDSPSMALGGPTGLTTLTIGSNTFLYAATFEGFSAFTLSGTTGEMLSPSGIADSAGVALAGAYDVITANLGGDLFAIAAGHDDNGIDLLLLSSGNPVSHFTSLTDNATTALAGARALATAVVGGKTYVFVAADIDNGLEILAFGSGGLAHHASVFDNATLELQTASAVTTAVVGGKTYIFVGGLTGISVFDFSSGGTPTNVFNISDTATLNLLHVQDLVTARIAGTTYLFAAGRGDSGVSAFAVAADGSLVNMANVADTPSLALNGASQLATVVIGGKTFLAVTALESGVSLFRIDTTGVTINGTAGADIVDATHAPAHQLLPSELGDTIFGLGGSDALYGLGGNDTLDGGAGNDILKGGAGTDSLRGGLGNDTYVLENGADGIIDTGGIDTVTSTISRSLASYTTVEKLTLVNVAAALNGTGNNLANTISGNNFNNLLNGGNGNDRLIGGAGNDNLLGAVGNDVLSGGTGNDLVTGGVGLDTLAGGPGNDSFIFNAPLSAANRDIITDFANAVGNNDIIRLENAVMTKLGAGVHALNAAFFRAGPAALDANDFIVYNKATGVLSYDANGSLAGGVTPLATLTTKPVLTAADFFVI